jgi:hypothetical protein
MLQNQMQMGGAMNMLAMMQQVVLPPAILSPCLLFLPLSLRACHAEMAIGWRLQATEAWRQKLSSHGARAERCVRCVQGMPTMPPMMAAAHGNPKNSNYKTRICLNWHKTGGCQYENRFRV